MPVEERSPMTGVTLSIAGGVGALIASNLYAATHLCNTATGMDARSPFLPSLSSLQPFPHRTPVP
ncbi:hypothetical protein E2C01_071508 [Portunus trituberculatus]|uniref:Uncharacterized protein n=1 Tax=Portunus trituberculatus TaxID=210409 RepID=A0A5B7I4M3_PORTR|nr:hypothetical protein [Portunus trituberculatus]